MADISQLTMTFVDGTTVIDANKMNSIVSKINELVVFANGGVTPSVVATPSITINNGVVTITCATSGATIRYTTNGSTPTSSSGNVYSTAFTPASGTTTIKAIAYKSGMTDSQVASKSYSGTSPEAAAVLAKFSNLSSSQRTKVETFVDTLVSNGIYSKLHYLSLPTMASTATEALQNVLNDVTPPTAESAVVSGGLKVTELVNLTDLLVAGMDYESYTTALAVELDTDQIGNTATIMRLNVTASGSATRYFENVSQTPSCNCTGYKSNGHSVYADGNLWSNVFSHSKTEAKEKWFNASGVLTSSDDDSTVPSNDGFSIGTNSTGTQYSVKFTGKYRFILVSELLTDAQMETLKSAMDTLLA